MRVLPQISVTTTPKTSERLGKKYLLATAGATAVLIAFSYRISESKETDFYTIPANQERKFTAPKGKKIWFIFCKVASGTSTLDLVASEMDIDLVSDPEVWQLQEDAVLDQANPVSGQKYGVGALGTAKKNVRLIYIAVKCVWTVQPSLLEIHLTINGRSIAIPRNDPETDIFYYPTCNANLEFTLNAVDPIQRAFFLDKSRSVKVEAEVTGGTVSNLSARVKWAKTA